ncbi:phosphoglycolate phosphatase [Sneathiella chinensis]|nr:phosphoglycolate phosphatase [Sneathiella chinensis]
MPGLRVLFDLDGTLLDTAPDLHGTLNYCLASAGRDTVTLESVKHMVGQGARVLLERGLIATGGLPSSAAFEELVDLFFAHYEHHLSDHSVPYPGMIDCLNRLRDMNCQMGVCTNKPIGFARRIIEDFSLTPYFPVMTGGDSFDVKKPDPGHIHKTLALFASGTGKAVMIGDTHNDIDAANAAGIGSVAVSFGYSEGPAHQLGAQHTIDHFDELIPILEKLA